MNFKFCPECGIKFDKEYKFCPECGFSLKPKKQEEALFDFSEDNTSVGDLNFSGFDRQLEQQEKAVEEEKKEKKRAAVQAEAERKASAEKLFNERSFTKAFPLCLEYAEAGDEKFQYMAGYCYNLGYGVKQNFTKAAELFQKSADSGYAPSQYSVGLMFELSRGYKKDVNKAVEWLKKAAENNCAKAYKELAYIFADTDIEQAKKWLLKFWEKTTDPRELYRAAEFYAYTGTSIYDKKFEVDNDEEKMYYWFEKSAEAGDINAMKYVASRKDTLARYTRAAEAGDAFSMSKLGDFYLEGRVFERDIEKAKYWFNRAAKLGNSSACRKLEELYDEIL